MPLLGSIDVESAMKRSQLLYVRHYTNIMFSFIYFVLSRYIISQQHASILLVSPLSVIFFLTFFIFFIMRFIILPFIHFPHRSITSISAVVYFITIYPLLIITNPFFFIMCIASYQTISRLPFHVNLYSNTSCYIFFIPSFPPLMCDSDPLNIFCSNANARERSIPSSHLLN